MNVKEFSEKILGVKLRKYQLEMIEEFESQKI